MNLWALKITDDSGVTYTICGTDDVLRSTYQQWIDGACTILETQGVCDSADRAEHTLAMRAEHIVAMSIYRMY